MAAFALTITVAVLLGVLITEHLSQPSHLAALYNTWLPTIQEVGQPRPLARTDSRSVVRDYVYRMLTGTADANGVLDGFQAAEQGPNPAAIGGIPPAGTVPSLPGYTSATDRVILDLTAIDSYFAGMLDDIYYGRARSLPAAVELVRKVARGLVIDRLPSQASSDKQVAKLLPRLDAVTLRVGRQWQKWPSMLRP